MKDSLAPQNATTTDTTSTNEMQGWIEKKLLESERKEADEARQKLAAIVVSSSDAIIGKTLDGIITSWNAAAERMYGYTGDEIVGKPITLLFPLDRQNEFTSIMEQIKKGERIDSYETTRVRKDGTILIVSVTVSPVKNTAGEI